MKFYCATVTVQYVLCATVTVQLQLSLECCEESVLCEFVSWNVGMSVRKNEHP
jgi:hypothetical protein